MSFSPEVGDSIGLVVVVLVFVVDVESLMLDGDSLWNRELLWM